MNGIRALVVDPDSALSDPALIIYNHWLQGHSIDRAAQLLCSAELSPTATATANATANATTTTTFTVSESILSLYRDEIQDAHRTFKVFEALLEQPNLLAVQSQIECPVDSAKQRQSLITLYYSFDSRVLREFMGVKLTSKLRSNLDDISDKTHVSIRSVRRQFDNLRRVHSRFEEVSVFRGNNCQQISTDFCLPSSLARRYAAASFLLYHRFDLETSDRKYQFLTWSDCEYMAIQVMAKLVTRPVLMMSWKDRQGVDSIFGIDTDSSRQQGNSTTVPSSTSGSEAWTKQGDGESGDSEGDRPSHSPSKLHALTMAGKTESVMGLDQAGTSAVPHASAMDFPFGPSISDAGFTASVDASGAQFALERRSSVDLAPAWLSDVRDMKTQMMGSSTTMEALIERVVAHIVRRRSGAASGASGVGSGSTTHVRKVTKIVVRNMLTIGGNLSQAKELRDFFEDVIENVCDPLMGLFYDGGSGGNDGSGGSGEVGEVGGGSGGDWEEVGGLRPERIGKEGSRIGRMGSGVIGGASGVGQTENVVAADTKIFFRALFDASCEAVPVKSLVPKRRERLLSSWRRYLDVIGCCTLRMMRRRLRGMR